jgi:hypothetical protein
VAGADAWPKVAGADAWPKAAADAWPEAILAAATAAGSGVGMSLVAADSGGAPTPAGGEGLTAAAAIAGPGRFVSAWIELGGGWTPGGSGATATGAD